MSTTAFSRPIIIVGIRIQATEWQNERTNNIFILQQTFHAKIEDKRKDLFDAIN